MGHDLNLLPTLAGALLAALALGYAAHRVGLSPVVGYLLAGVAIGKYTPGFVADQHLAEQLAEVGVILLLFGVGLHFQLDDLLAVWRIAVPGALLQIAGASALGAAVATVFGWTVGAGVVFGLALSVASTVVLLRVLSDQDEQHTPAGHIAIGWLVVEDLVTVLVLVVLPTWDARSPVPPTGTTIALALGGAGLKLAALVALALLVGQRLIRAVLCAVAKTRSRELFTLTVLVLALGLALAAARWFGASFALGAFLAGMVVGQSPYAARAAAEALPMRDAFAVLFFVSVGMLLDPRILVDQPALVAATLAVVMLGKPLLATVVAVLLRYPPAVALTVGVALGQIGEFSFIVAGLGKQLAILPAAATGVLVAAAVVSITVNPWLFAAARRAGRRWGGPPVMAANEPLTTAAAPRAVVVGYGPVGQGLCRILRQEGLQPVVIELNPETVARLTAAGQPAVYGDVAQREVQVQAGLPHAQSLFLTADGPLDPQAVALARELQPRLRVVARARYVGEVPALLAAGADQVVVGELEVAWALAEDLLAALGASPEQLDRERERLRGRGGATVDGIASDC